MQTTIDEIKHLHRDREAAMVSMFRINNALGARARTVLGFRNDLPKKDQDRIKKDAAKIVDGQVPPRLEKEAGLLAPWIAACEVAIKPFFGLKDHNERQLGKLAKNLPCCQFIKNTRGLDYLGLACIVGEAGDLANYPTPLHLRKRMGFAPPEVYRAPTKDGGTALFVPRRRKSVLWRIVDSLIKTNKGKYKAMYDNAKVAEIAKAGPDHPTIQLRKSRKLKDGTEKPAYSKHCDLRARRRVAQTLLNDLWSEWRAGSALKSSQLVNCPPLTATYGMTMVAATWT